MKLLIPTLLLVSLASVLRATTSAGNLPLDIGVRSTIDRPFKGWGKEAVKEHGKVYALASVSEARSEQQLVLPLDEKILMDALHRELAKRGYRETTAAEPSEIILTILYGRGYLKNPFLGGAMVNGFSDPPVATILGANPEQLVRQKEFDYERKLQGANFEKLFIRVTAWANPDNLPEPKPGKRKKNRILWETTMVTDDPIHRDLNQFVSKLLAAGSEFFDREMDDVETEVRTDLPEGFVEYGDATVVEDGDK